MLSRPTFIEGRNFHAKSEPTIKTHGIFNTIKMDSQAQDFTHRDRIGKMA